MTITCSNNNGTTTHNICFDTEEDIILQPLVCGCPKQGKLRIQNPAGSCNLSSSDEIFDFGYDAGCNSVADVCDQHVQNSTTNTCHTLTSCGTP